MRRVGPGQLPCGNDMGRLTGKFMKFPVQLLLRSPFFCLLVNKRCTVIERFPHPRNSEPKFRHYLMQTLRQDVILSGLDVDRHKRPKPHRMYFTPLNRRPDNKVIVGKHLIIRFSQTALAIKPRF